MAVLYGKVYSYILAEKRIQKELLEFFLFTNTAQELKTTQGIELRIITWVFKPIGLIDADHVYNVRIPSRSTSF